MRNQNELDIINKKDKMDKKKKKKKVKKSINNKVVPLGGFDSTPDSHHSSQVEFV